VTDTERPATALVDRGIGTDFVQFPRTLAELGYVRSNGRLFALRPRVLELGYAYLSSLSLHEHLLAAARGIKEDLSHSPTGSR
jgi:IclR family pca regulon transcriptional regulator